MADSKNSFKTKSTIVTPDGDATFFSLPKLADAGFKNINRLPFSIKILLENLLRNEDGSVITRTDIENLAKWGGSGTGECEIPFMPARVLLQDFTGVPAVADLAAMRTAADRFYSAPEKVNPKIPAELVIDHSVQVDSFGIPESFAHNLDKEFERNFERYAFLRWGQESFNNFSVVPPATGICHQINLEYLARVVFLNTNNDKKTVYPDTLVGLDSHTTMVNGAGVLGWGVGGIEAEAVLLGRPYYMVMPKVVGFRLTGALSKGVTATDLVLTITQMLREKGVVGKFVEFHGSGLKNLSLEDRATISNMSPEYGATAGFFPVDEKTLQYLKLTGRSARQTAGQITRLHAMNPVFIRLSPAALSNILGMRRNRHFRTVGDFLSIVPHYLAAGNPFRAMRADDCRPWGKSRGTKCQQPHLVSYSYTPAQKGIGRAIWRSGGGR